MKQTEIFPAFFLTYGGKFAENLREIVENNGKYRDFCGKYPADRGKYREIAENLRPPAENTGK